MRWFVRVQKTPGVYAVYFGPNGVSASKLHLLLCSLVPGYHRPEIEWRRTAYETKPRWTPEAPRRAGWRRAKSKHIGVGLRVFVECGIGVRNDTQYRQEVTS